MCSPTNKLQLFRYFPQFGLMVLISCGSICLSATVAAVRGSCGFLKGVLVSYFPLLSNWFELILVAHSNAATLAVDFRCWLYFWIQKFLIEINVEIWRISWQKERCVRGEGELADVAKTKDTLWQWRGRIARLSQNVTYTHVQTCNKLHKCCILKPTRYARYSYSCPRSPDMSWRFVALTLALSLCLSLPLRLSGLTSCRAGLQRERERARECRHSRLSKAPEVLTYSRNRHRLADYLLPSVPFPCPVPLSFHNSPFPTLDSTAANVNVRGCCSFCFRFWGNFVPLCVVKCLNWAAGAWRHHINSNSSSPTKNLNIKWKNCKDKGSHCYSLWESQNWILLPSLQDLTQFE